MAETVLSLSGWDIAPNTIVGYQKKQFKMSEEFLEFLLKFSIPYLIIIVSLFNITMRWGDDKLWIVLLCSCISYLIPSPEMRQSIKTLQTFDKVDKIQK